MTDFLTRVARTAQGLNRVAKVLGTPRYVPGSGRLVSEIVTTDERPAGVSLFDALEMEERQEPQQTIAEATGWIGVPSRGDTSHVGQAHTLGAPYAEPSEENSAAPKANLRPTALFPRTADVAADRATPASFRKMTAVVRGAMAPQPAFAPMPSPAEVPADRAPGASTPFLGTIDVSGVERTSVDAARPVERRAGVAADYRHEAFEPASSGPAVVTPSTSTHVETANSDMSRSDLPRSAIAPDVMPATRDSTSTADDSGSMSDAAAPVTHQRARVREASDTANVSLDRPIVRVSIGRMDVWAAPPLSPPPVETRTTPAPRISLDEYLRLHNGRKR